MNACEYVHVIVLIFVGNMLSTGFSWTYTAATDGISTWTSSYPQCGSVHQSPIDLGTSKSVYASSLGQISIAEDSSVTGASTLSNDGHTAKITFPTDKWSISFNGNTYGVVQLHFHWGSSDIEGSEHTVDSVKHSLEAHFVCYDKGIYSNYAAANAAPNGHAVVGFLFKPGSSSTTDEPWVTTVTNALSNVQAVSSTFSLTTFNISNMFSNVNPSRYYRYSGSLTTPDCRENVVWTVMADVLEIKPTTLAQFRTLDFASGESTSKMGNNYRPTQSLNPVNTRLPRQLFRSFTGGSSSIAATVVFVTAFNLIGLL